MKVLNRPTAHFKLRFSLRGCFYAFAFVAAYLGLRSLVMARGWLGLGFSLPLLLAACAAVAAWGEGCSAGKITAVAGFVSLAAGIAVAIDMVEFDRSYNGYAGIPRPFQLSDAHRMVRVVFAYSIGGTFIGFFCGGIKRGLH